ncbi:hypothetical protein HWV62_11670 [Athelia sp. TMB]|nr:hypothetical protein HWV62_11670 [Athelia sp. TMB]
MSQDLPPLVLSDIVHGMSPSPGPQDTTPDRDVMWNHTSEQFDEERITVMRKRVLELSSIPGTGHELNFSESEMLEMVVKQPRCVSDPAMQVLALTSRSDASSAQLLHQAELIANLTEQRDFLIREANAQKERWKAERAGWEREAEALITQRAHGSAGQWNPWSGYVKDAAAQQREREYLGLVSDNNSLRTKLNDAQYRLGTMESQLNSLRPVLLTQPMISREAFRQSSSHLAKAQSTVSKLVSSPPPTPASTATQPAAVPSSQPEPSVTSVQILLGDGSEMQFMSLSQQLHDEGYLHPSKAVRAKRRDKGKAKEKTRRKGPIMDDARAEHLLLAARRLGRRRACMLGGLVHVEKGRVRVEREERRRVDAEIQAKKKHRAKACQKGLSGLLVSADLGRGEFPQVLAAPGGSSFSTFALSPPRKPAAPVQSPRTPLDSLLSAARSMMDPSDLDNSDSETASASEGGGGSSSRKRRMPESPLPTKRRKASGTAHTKRAMQADRARSALDVLADQAAAFSSGNGKGKGKGKEPQRSMGAGQGVFQARLPLAESGGWSSLKPVQWGAGEAASPFIGEMEGLEGESGVDQVASEKYTLKEDPLSGHKSQAMVNPMLLVDRTPPPSTQVSHTPPASDDAPQPDAGIASPGTGSATSVLLNIRQHASARPESLDITPLNAMVMDNAQLPIGTSPKLSMEGLTSMPEFDTLEDIAMEQAVSRDLARVGVVATTASKRTRSPYVKWSQEEDDKLAQAVATYGQKWDLVQKDLPNRGYHQVRQRWLRKLGVFDPKPDVSTYQTGFIGFPVGANITQQPLEAPPLPQPKLGLAPLSSDISFVRRL